MKYRAGVNNKEVIKKYPSSFGSHKVMLSEDHTEFNESQTEVVVCKDDRGLYVTDRKTLDNGICDRKRIDPTDVRKSRLELHEIS